MGVMYPEAVMKNIIPVVMAGVIGIYGLIVAVIISLNISPPVNFDGVFMINVYTWEAGIRAFAAGLSIGVSGLVGGYANGVIGDQGQKAVGLRPQLFVMMILVISFVSAVPLFGLIGAMLFSA